MKSFPALKRLKLCLILVYNKVEDNIDVNQLFSFELFKGFSNITHLSLTLDSRHLFDESILREIDIYLPKLQYLEFNYRFLTTPEGVTQMADILSRLSRLETLKLKFKSEDNLKETIEEQIIEKCRKIKEMKIEFRFYIHPDNYPDPYPVSDDDCKCYRCREYEEPEDDNHFNYDYNYDYESENDFYLE